MNCRHHSHDDQPRRAVPDYNAGLAATLSDGGITLALHFASPGSPWESALNRERITRAARQTPKHREN